jgi:hypothetical protein
MTIDRLESGNSFFANEDFFGMRYYKSEALLSSVIWLNRAPRHDAPAS